jgi:hypothetical protein
MANASRLLRLRPLGAIDAAGLAAVLNAMGIEDAADDLVPQTGKVLGAAAFDHDNGVLLEIVPDARDIGRDFDTVAQAHARDLPERRVRLLRGHGGHFQADAALERATALQDRTFAVKGVEGGLQGRKAALGLLQDPTVLHQLVHGRHGGNTPK